MNSGDLLAVEGKSSVSVTVFADQGIGVAGRPWNMKFLCGCRP